MRWEDERYVRLYIRETPEWAVLSWEARAVFHEILKKVDRAGILLVGKSGTRGLAGLLRMPIDVVERGLTAQDGLLEDGCLVATEGGYMLPNFMEAQEAKQSDKTRKQEQRARDRADRLKAGQPVTPRDESGQPVTPCDHESRNVTEGHAGSRDVQSGHTESPPVTGGHSEPCLAVPSRAVDLVENEKPKAEPKAPKASAKPKPDPEPPHPRHAEIVKAYFVAFESARGAKPVFDARSGKDVKTLLAKCNGDADKAIAIIRAAFGGDPFKAKNATITTIAADPSKYLGGNAPPTRPHWKPPVQPLSSHGQSLEDWYRDHPPTGDPI